MWQGATALGEAAAAASRTIRVHGDAFAYTTILRVPLYGRTF